MGFDTFIGNRNAVTLLERCINSGQAGGAYLFVGPEGIGKRTLALQFAANLLCSNSGCLTCPDCRKILNGTHPDVSLLLPRMATRIHQAEDMRSMSYHLSLKPTQSRWSISIIDQADRMRPEASNALLKTIEEPPAHAVIVLLTTNASSMLPTVLSRCRQVKFLPCDDSLTAGFLISAHGVSGQEATAAARLAAGRPGLAVRMLAPSEALFRNMILDLLLKEADKPDPAGRMMRLDRIMELIEQLADEAVSEPDADMNQRIDTRAAKRMEEDYRNRRKAETMRRMLEIWDTMLLVSRDALVLSRNSNEKHVLCADRVSQLESFARHRKNSLSKMPDVIARGRRAMLLSINPKAVLFDCISQLGSMEAA